MNACNDFYKGGFTRSVFAHQRMDFTAIGDTVNTAARLESNAGPGQILISAYVREQLGNRIEAESVGEIPLKGKSNRIEVFSVDSVKEDGGNT